MIVFRIAPILLGASSAVAAAALLIVDQCLTSAAMSGIEDMNPTQYTQWQFIGPCIVFGDFPAREVDVVRSWRRYSSDMQASIVVWPDSVTNAHAEVGRWNRALQAAQTLGCAFAPPRGRRGAVVVIRLRGLAALFILPCIIVSGAALMRWTRFRIRHKRGLCAHCGYPILASGTQTCPECGQRD